MATLFAVTLPPTRFPPRSASRAATKGVTPTERLRSRPRVGRAAPVRHFGVGRGPPGMPRRVMDIDPLRPRRRLTTRLDHQLNQLMMNPTAFAQRLEHVGQRDRFIARLAERAAERGDAPRSRCACARALTRSQVCSWIACCAHSSSSTSAALIARRRQPAALRCYVRVPRSRARNGESTRRRDLASGCDRAEPKR